MERENRYLILKRADIEDHLDDKYKERLDGICAHIQQCREYYGKRNTKYVVVADDWPMYEQVWGLVESWVDGGASSSIGCSNVPSELDVAEDKIQELETLITVLRADIRELYSMRGEDELTAKYCDAILTATADI